jgi:hypothetical protein
MQEHIHSGAIKLIPAPPDLGKTVLIAPTTAVAAGSASSLLLKV